MSNSSGLWNGQNPWETPRCSTENWIQIVQQSAPPKLGFTLWLLWPKHCMIFCSCTNEKYIRIVLILFVINWHSRTNLLFVKYVGENGINIVSVKMWGFDAGKLDTESNWIELTDHGHWFGNQCYFPPLLSHVLISSDVLDEQRVRQCRRVFERQHFCPREVAYCIHVYIMMVYLSWCGTKFEWWVDRIGKMRCYCECC